MEKSPGTMMWERRMELGLKQVQVVEEMGVTSCLYYERGVIVPTDTTATHISNQLQLDETAFMRAVETQRELFFEAKEARRAHDYRAAATLYERLIERESVPSALRNFTTALECCRAEIERRQLAN